MRLILRILILMVLLVTTSYATEKPGIRISVDMGATDNLYFDYSAENDLLLNVLLDLDLPVTNSFSAFYHSSYAGYSESKELESFDHVAGISYTSTWGQFGSFWLEAGGNKRLFNSPYDIYDQDGLFVVTGATYDFSSGLQMRLNFEWSNSVYPEYTRRVNRIRFVTIDYNDYSINLGSNFSLWSVYAVDLEAGIQERRYAGDDGPSTSFLVMKTRISRQLNRNTGLAFYAQYHNQVDPGEHEIFTFYSRGVNAHEQLWDGWDTGLVLTRFLGQWRLQSTIAYRNTDYVEIPVLLERRLGLKNRSDKALNVDVDLRRVIYTNHESFRIWWYADYCFERNLSTVAYYEYDLNEIHAGITAEW